MGEPESQGLKPSGPSELSDPYGIPALTSGSPALALAPAIVKFSAGRWSSFPPVPGDMRELRVEDALLYLDQVGTLQRMLLIRLVLKQSQASRTAQRALNGGYGTWNKKSVSVFGKLERSSLTRGLVIVVV